MANRTDTDGDTDEASPVYLDDAQIGPSGIHLPDPNQDGAVNARLIAATVGPAHGVDDVTAYKGA